MITKNWQEGCSLEKPKTCKLKRKTVLYNNNEHTIMYYLNIYDTQPQCKLWIWYEYDMSLEIHQF